MTFATVLLVICIGFIAALTGLVIHLADLIRDIRDSREERTGGLYFREDTDPFLAWDVNEVIREHRIGGRG